MKRLLRKPIGIALLLSIVFAAGIPFGVGYMLEPLELRLLNFNYRLRSGGNPFPKEIVLVEINNQSEHYRKRWPWSAEDLAKLFDILRESGSKLVALELPLLKEFQTIDKQYVDKLMEQFSTIHPKQDSKTATPKGRLTQRQRDDLKKQQEQQKKIEAMRVEIQNLLKNPSQEKLLASLKQLPNLIYGYHYYRTEKDIPGVDLYHIKQLEEQSKKAASADAKKPAAAEQFRRLGKARFLAGAPPFDPASEVFALRGNDAIVALARYHGFINLEAPEHQAIHSIPMFARRGDQVYPSFALATYIASQGEEPARLVGKEGYVALEIGNRELQLESDGRLRLNYYGPRMVIPEEQRFLAGNMIEGKGYLKDSFKNKIVLVGFSSGDLGRNYITPFRTSFSSLELQATALANLMQASTLRRMAMHWQIEMGLLIFLALLIGLLMHKLGFFSGLFITVGLLSGLHILYILIFFPEGEWYKLTYTYISLIVIFMGVYVIRQLTAGNLLQQTKERFQFRLNKDDYIKVIADPDQYSGEGVWRSLTVISGHAAQLGTNITAEHDPKHITRLLAHLTNPMAEVLKRNYAMIHTLDGQTYKAFFNAPIERPNHAELACQAALQMQFEWESFLPRWQQEGMPSPIFGLGLDTGSGIIGNIGGDQQFIYSFVGSPVEISDILKELNRHYASRILISENLQLALKDKPKFLLRELDLVQFAEDMPAIPVYELLGTASTQTPLAEVIQWYAQGLIFYRARNFQEAIRYFQEITRIRPTDGPAYTMLHRSQNYLHYPPSFQWDGSWKMPSAGA